MIININCYKLHFRIHWFLQTLCTAEQVCRNSLVKDDMHFLKHVCFLAQTCIYDEICYFAYFRKHQIDAERKDVRKCG